MLTFWQLSSANLLSAADVVLSVQCRCSCQGDVESSSFLICNTCGAFAALAPLCREFELKFVLCEDEEFVSPLDFKILDDGSSEDSST